MKLLTYIDIFELHDERVMKLLTYIDIFELHDERIMKLCPFRVELHLCVCVGGELADVDFASIVVAAQLVGRVPVHAWLPTAIPQL